MHQQSNDNPLDKVLLSFKDDKGNNDTWTAEDAVRGVSILGATGSGKTSGSGRALALKYLKEGWGGIVLTVKPDEAKLWIDYCNSSDINRGNDIVLFGNNSKHTDGEFKDQPMVFNPIDYEMNRGGEGAGDTQNIINLFMNIYRMGNRIAQEGDISKEERFWDSALKRCIGKTVELLKLAKLPLSMANICGIMASCCSYDETGLVVSNEVIAKCALVVEGILVGKAAKQYENEIYYCPMAIALADKQFEIESHQLDEEEYEYRRNLLHQVKSYFLQFLNALDEKTKFTIIESFMGLAEPFTQGILNKHFSGKTTIKPEETFKGKIIILNFPVKQYLDVGIIAQCVFKLMFQQAVERREIKENTLPVFLWADEAHMFVNPYDQLFLTTARSVRCSTVYLTQSISNYFAVMGSGSDSRSKVDSLMGNLTTKIFHANADAETNEYASRLIGQSYGQLDSNSKNEGFMSLNFSSSKTQATQLLPQVLPMTYTQLRTGGKNNSFTTDAYVVVTGKTWSNKRNFIKTQFIQNFKK